MMMMMVMMMKALLTATIKDEDESVEAEPSTNWPLES